MGGAITKTDTITENDGKPFRESLRRTFSFQKNKSSSTTNTSVTSIIEEEITATIKRRPSRGKNLFAKSELNTKTGQLTRSESFKGITPTVLRLVKDSLSSHNILNPQNEDGIIGNLDREVFKANHILFRVGDASDRLYIVESGLLDIIVKDIVIRSIGPGGTLGELSLFCDSPQTFTVRCNTSSILWSLKREVFQEVEAFTTTESHTNRVRWLMNCPEFAILSRLELSRLIGAMKTQFFEEGEYLYKEEELTSKCILIEKGEAEVFSEQVGSRSSDIEEMDRQFQIVRPQYSQPEKSHFESPQFNIAGISQKLSSFIGAKGILSPRLTTPSTEDVTKAPLMEIHEGTFIGLGILRGKAMIPGNWTWVKNSSKFDQGTESGATSPISVIATEKIEALVLNVGVFEEIFGQINVVDENSGSDRKFFTCRGVTDNNVQEEKKIIPTKFSSLNFRTSVILGTGTYGVVVMGEFQPTESLPFIDHSKESNSSFALKILSKTDIIEMGQVRHLMDEAKILSELASPFIMKLYGTYQTNNELVLVTELLMGGDLWSVIYDTERYKRNTGLSISLAQFYTASIISALGHIHDKGIVYRDLKPENVLIDSKGYIRLIDFGFAKKVPYKKTDANGREKEYVKTYTLCGTPGYII